MRFCANYVVAKIGGAAPKPPEYFGQDDKDMA